MRLLSKQESESISRHEFLKTVNENQLTKQETEDYMNIINSEMKLWTSFNYILYWERESGSNFILKGRGKH